MASLQKRYRTDSGGKKRLKGYYAIFRDADRRPAQKEVSLKTRDAQAARARMADLERAHARGEYDPWTSRTPQLGAVTASEAVDRFLASRAETGSESGVATYRSVLVPFERSLPPGLMLTQVRREHVDGWLASLSVADATRDSYADRLRIFAGWCRDESLAPPVWQPAPPPLRGNRGRREVDVRYFTADQLAQLLRTLDARLILAGKRASHVDRLLARIVPFAAGTGLRRGEVCALRWAAVALGGPGGAYVRVANTDTFTTKSGLGRTVPLVGDALTALRVQAESRTSEDPAAPVFCGARGGALNDQYLGKRFRLLLRAARLPGSAKHNFHSLRHTFGTLAVQRGVDVYRLKEIMGHADIKTTLRYAKLHPATLMDAMQAAFGEGLLVGQERAHATEVSS